jgi:hypothetical protein
VPNLDAAHLGVGGMRKLARSGLEDRHALVRFLASEKNKNTAEGDRPPQQAKTGLAGDPRLCHMSLAQDMDDGSCLRAGEIL